MITNLRYLGRVEPENSFYWGRSENENIFDYENNEYRLFVMEIRTPTLPSSFPGVKLFALRKQSIIDNQISWYSLMNVEVLQGPDGFFTFKYNKKSGIPGINRNNGDEPINPIPENSERELNRLFSPTLREEKLGDLGI